MMYKVELVLVMPTRRIIPNVLIHMLRCLSYLMLNKNKNVLLVSYCGELLDFF